MLNKHFLCLTSYCYCKHSVLHVVSVRARAQIG